QPGRPRLPRRRRRRARPRRLLPRGRGANLGERDQHDPGLHAHLGLPAALGGHGTPVPAAGRSADRAGPRTSRAEARPGVSRLRPDVVVATGGFVALPTALAAAARRRPLLVHEQVVVPGLANRVIARVAGRVAVTFAASAVAFPAEKVVVTGNPVRPELLGG